MLLCDAEGCAHGYHLACLSPPLACVPEDDWFCPECAAAAGSAVAPTATAPAARAAAAATTSDHDDDHADDDDHDDDEHDDHDHDDHDDHDHDDDEAAVIRAAQEAVRGGDTTLGASGAKAA
eukprot:scaffold70503_cov21-Phaeocystis_antarctica.AAC.1